MNASRPHLRSVVPVLAGFGALLATATTAGAAALPPTPCPAGIAVLPTFKAVDTQDDSTRRLTATHVITVTAVFPETGPISVDDYETVWSGPRGVPVITSRSRNADDVDVYEGNRGYVPTRAGALPITVSWPQSDGTRDGMCTGTTRTTLRILAARPLRAGLPRSTSGAPANGTSEYTWDMNVGTGSDRRPIQIRLRSLRGTRVPGARVPFKTATIALRQTDPGWQATPRLVAPFLGLGASYEGASIGFVHLMLGVRNRTSNPRFGYELQIVQGGRRVARIRAAGKCSAFGCEFPTYSLQR